MAGRPSPDESSEQRDIREALRLLDEHESTIYHAASEEGVRQLLAGTLRSALQVLSASLGECRQETPYTPLRPVIDAEGQFLWCCNHEEEHCVRGA